MRRFVVTERPGCIGRGHAQALRRAGGLVAAMFLVVAIAGCKGGGTSPTTTVEVINDAAPHHLGDELRTDFVVRVPEGQEHTYPFSVSGKVLSATLQLTVNFMGSVGADVLVNGVVVLSMPPPSPSGTVNQSISTSPSPFVEGQNALTIRSRSDASGAQDFEYNSIKLTVTISG